MRTLLLRLLVVMPLVLGTLLLPVSLFAAGGIATDGTLGQPSKIISTPGSTANVVIEQNTGVTKGTNLFHSFDHFNIAKDQTVTFKETINHSLDNIISRVTGGSVSTIEGLLEVTPEGHANFYLINPNGVTFGPKGSVNVKGDLHVTTADELRFSNGLKFSASQPNTSRLSAAAPSSFGFLGALPSNNSLIKIEDSWLELNQGQQLDLSAANIELIYSYLYVPEGQIRLAAVSGLATLGIKEIISLPNFKPTDANAGNITINLSWLESSGNGSGRIAMWGNDIISNYSWILADNIGAKHATPRNGVFLNADTLTLKNSVVGATASDAGNGGKIQMRANNMAIIDGSEEFGSITTETNAKGKSGNIVINIANNFSMSQGAEITTGTYNKGQAGNIIISAKNIHIDADGEASGISTASGGSGNAGNITMNARDTLSLKQGGIIASASFGKGDAGDIKMTAKNILIDGVTDNSEALITSFSKGNGDAGDITIHAKEKLDLDNNGGIAAPTLSRGRGGNIFITANDITIAGNSTMSAGSSTRLNTKPDLLGKAGNITIRATGDVKLSDSARIDALTLGNKPGGNIQVTANNLTLNGEDTSIFATTKSSGRAGEVNLTLNNDLTIKNGANISTSTKAGGSAGSVTITADKLFIDSDGSVTSDSIGRLSSGKTGTIDIKIKDQLQINSGSLRIINEAQNLTTAEASKIKPGVIIIGAHDISLTDSTITSASSGNVDAGDININAEGRLTLNPSSITTNANQGNGGNIQIKSGAIMRLQNADITTNVKGATGNGGDISIDAEQLIMQTGLIQANTVAKGGLGGDIRLNLNALIASGNRLRLGGTEPLLWQPNSFGNNIIQAAAPSGLSGNIDSSAPQLNLSGELANLGTLNFGSVFLSRDYCSLGSGSSLTHTGKGGLTLKGRDAWVY